MTTRSRLSCSEFSFPALSLDDRLALVRLLGFQLVDMGLFLDTDEQVGAFLSDPGGMTRRMAAALERMGLDPVDLFLIVGGDDFARGALTSPDNALRERLRHIFLAALDCASALGVQGCTVLPGLHWDDGDHGSWSLAVHELQWRVEQAARSGLELRIEPHLGSIVATPELALALLRDVPGLRLSLDAGHFVFQDIPMERIARLAPFTGHVHLSGARPGGVCVPWKHNVVDFPSFITSLESAGFSGEYCVEYVPMDKWGADGTDIVTATVTMRDIISAVVV